MSALNLSDIVTSFAAAQLIALQPCESCGAPHGCKVALHYPIRPTRKTVNDQLGCDDCWAEAQHLDPEYVRPEHVFVDCSGRVVVDHEGDL